MDCERELARYAAEVEYREFPRESIDIVKKVILTVLGTTIAGATAEGCEAIVAQVREWGGREEATILLHGGKVPAHNAVLANSVMARALDFCDAMSPGIHIGSSAVPTALATAELVGGCSGEEFLAAIAAGSEIAARMNGISYYDGFDPTGVCGVFAAAVVAGRMLRLDSRQMLHALALAFNRAGGSFQSNVDGSLAVRAIQGFVSQAGIVCAQLAKRGITGPRNFLEGIYGYFHLYARGRRDPQRIVGDLGKRFDLHQTIFKKYPSCGCTLASTDAVLELMEQKDLSADNVARVDIRVSPYAYKLAGHRFEIGDTPKVNAQFSIQYCAGNALLRGGSKLNHFDETSILDEKLQGLLQKIHVFSDPALGAPCEKGASGSTHLSVRLEVTTTEGAVYRNAVDIPRGNPKNPLAHEEHMERFRDCVKYAGKGLANLNIDRLLLEIEQLEHTKDVRVLVSLLLPNQDTSSSLEEA
ncbi:MAG: MmgE/PrpD family protein [Thermodesulfobacteriota bacterium]